MPLNWPKILPHQAESNPYCYNKNPRVTPDGIFIHLSAQFPEISILYLPSLLAPPLTKCNKHIIVAVCFSLWFLYPATV